MMDVQNVKVLSVTVEPTTQVMEDQVLEEKNMTDLSMTLQETIESFSDEVPVVEITPEQEANSKKFVSDFVGFIQGDNFRNTINEASRRLGVPPKRLAKHFLMKVLGVAGDVLGIAISTAGDVVHTVVNVISTILHSGVALICRFASGLARIITLNQTATARA